MESAAGVLDETLTVALPETFGGLFITNSRDFHVIAMSTVNTDEARILAEAAALGLADVTEVRAARWSIEQLTADAHRVSDTLAGHVDVDVNVFENEVRVSALASKVPDAATLPKSARIQIVPMLAQPTAEVYGGAHLSSCTSGFSVRLNGTTTKGITTAGHCSDSQSWFGTAFPFKAERLGGSSDSQWHTTPGYTPVNKIRDSAGGSWRYVLAVTPAANQALGSLVCHYGQTTAYGCGRLSTKTLAPAWVPNSNGTFHMISRTTSSPGDLSSPGDSGGPVFSSSSAWGTTSGEYWSFDYSCLCQNVYAPTNYISNGMNITILTS